MRHCRNRPLWDSASAPLPSPPHPYLRPQLQEPISGQLRLCKVKHLGLRPPCCWLALELHCVGAGATSGSPAPAPTAATSAPSAPAAAAHALIQRRVLAAEEGLCPGGACV
jgi:hypothetical protein